MLGAVGFAVVLASALLSAALPASTGSSNVPDRGLEATTPTTDTEALVGLLTFSPRRSDAAVNRLAQRFPQFGTVERRRRFFAARLRDFRAMVNRYGMLPNDLATADAFAIVAGYRAYNGARLSDPVSARILLASVAVRIASDEGGAPWSDDRKQARYETVGGEAAALNWSLERAMERGDAASMKAVRSWAHAMLRRELGREPSGVTPDTYACISYRDAPCADVIRALREEFATPQ